MARLKALDGIKFTPLEQKIIDRLSDGLSHPSVTLLALWDDPTAEHQLLHNVINQLRRKVLSLGFVIVSERAFYREKAYYRLARRAASMD